MSISLLITISELKLLNLCLECLIGYTIPSMTLTPKVEAPTRVF